MRDECETIRQGREKKKIHAKAEYEQNKIVYYDLSRL